MAVEFVAGPWDGERKEVASLSIFVSMPSRCGEYGIYRYERNADGSVIGPDGLINLFWHGWTKMVIA